MNHIKTITKWPEPPNTEEELFDLTFIIGSLQFALTVLQAFETKKASQEA